jgi:hypothetical protein
MIKRRGMRFKKFFMVLLSMLSMCPPQLGQQGAAGVEVKVPLLVVVQVVYAHSA